MNYLQQYQSFETKYALNEAISLHLHEHSVLLNQTDFATLTLLSRYAVKYPGVAHLKMSTIAGILNKSTRTIRRSIEKLEQLNIMQRQTFAREKSGGQGANLYIFQPFKRVEEPAAVRQEVHFPKTSEIAGPIQVEQEERVTFYTRFRLQIESYIGEDAALARKLYGVYRVHSIRLMKFEIHKDKGVNFQDIALQGVRILFQTTKRKKIYNLVGYYDGIYRELVDQTLFPDAFMDYAEPVEFFMPE